MRLLLTCIFFISLQACVHINSKIESLPIRASKSQIFQTLGQPFKVERIGGKDHWIYKFIINGRHYTRAVIIKDGMLYKKGNFKPYSLKTF